MTSVPSLPVALRPDSGSWPPLRGFAITLRHTTVGRTPLDKWSARRRHLYVTTHSTHKRQTDIHAAGEIITHIPSKRAASNPLFRRRGHRDRQFYGLVISNYTLIITTFLNNLMFSDRASWIDYTLITNLMHWLLFIHKILFSSTCFEHQVLIFRRT